MISANYAEMRIDLDAEESVHHVKTDNLEEFGLFLEQLQQHRLYTQNISNNGQVNYRMYSERDRIRGQFLNELPIYRN